MSGSRAAAAVVISCVSVVPSLRSAPHAVGINVEQAPTSTRILSQSHEWPPSDTYRPANGVTLPRVLHDVKPPYTADAMRARIQGSVLLECVVETDGRVNRIHIVRSLDAVFGLDQEAVKAAEQWRFTPGTRDGAPVPVLVTIEMTFSLGDTPHETSAASAGRRPAIAPTSTPVTPGRFSAPMAIEGAVKAAYQREFGQTIVHPAIYNNPQAVNCTDAGHLTTTAYVRTGTTTTLFSMYMSRDGATVTRKTRRSVVLAPAGTIRILVVLIRYPETISADALALWEDAQKQINDEHAIFAKSRGYDAPIVVFDNTNILIDRVQIEDPHNQASVRAAAERRGFSPANYQIVMAIDMNPQEGAGGFSSEQSVYVGNYSYWKTPLDAAQWKMIAGTAYHHELAHHWGWPGTHDWAGSCGHQQVEYAPFIAPPILFGWEDLDGDGAPDILTEAPGGRFP